MQITQPDYYDSFSCIAGDCPDTCCASWQVVLDDEHAARYRKTEGELGEAMRRGMVRIDGEDCFALHNGRCCMLLQDGLCRIQKELGEAALSQTCGFYPRFVTELGLMREQGLSISCPEVARIILTRQEPTRFQTLTTDEPLRYFHDIEPETILYVKQTRAEAIAIMQNRNLPFAQRLCRILQLVGGTELSSANAQEYAAFREAMYALFLSLEQLRADWTEQLQRGKAISAPRRLQEDVAWEELFCYYAFKYSLRAAMDEDFEEKLRLAAVNILLLQDLYAQTELSLVQLVQLHARETEHNEENMQRLTDAMAHDVRFSAQSLQQILNLL